MVCNYRDISKAGTTQEDKVYKQNNLNFSKILEVSALRFIYEWVICGNSSAFL